MRMQPGVNQKSVSSSEQIPATRPKTSLKVVLASLILAIATCLAFIPIGALADQGASGSSSQANSEVSNQAAPQGSLMAGSFAPGTASNNDALPDSNLATQASTVIASGYCGTTVDYDTGEPLDGKNMTWKLYDDYTLEISGTGMMAICNEYSSPSGSSPVPGWYDYRESITNIVIDEGVEHIGPAAFAHTAITSITLPSSVKRIEQLAFKGCSQLKDVNLNAGLEYIGVEAFRETAVTSLFIPATMKEIDNSIFKDIDVNQLVIDPLSPYFSVDGGILYGDNNTRTIASTWGFSGAFEVPTSVTTIGGGTFESRGITSVTIPNSVTTIGDGAFNISNLASITIPDSVTNLGRSAFSNSPIVTAKIGKGLKDLGTNSAFAFDRSLKNVEFSEGLEVVSERSFGGCTALERIDLPTSVRTIEENAFNGCSSLSTVTFGPNVQEIGKAAFANCPSLTTVTLPDSLTTIGEGAFYGTGLTSVAVPDSVTSIGANAFPETAAVTVPDMLVELEDGSYVSRDSVTELSYEVTYGQTEARRMLGLLNEFRAGDEAWYWSENDTEKVQASGLDGLVYDYTLERTAMKRAAEVAILYSHTRPDGTPCFTAFEGSYSYMGENIAWGYSSAEQVMEAWKETNYGYSGQGHRRNMLSNEFNAVGIGHVVYNGMHVWAQDFGYASTPDTAMTAANDSGTSASVVLKNANITSHSDVVCEPASYTLEQGDVEALPVLTVSNVRFTAGSESGSVAYATVEALWQSEDPTVATVADGNVEACAFVGNTRLAAMAFGKEVTVPVSVARNLERAEINLSGAQFNFTGSEIKPVVSVTDGSAQLKEGVDYVVTYSDNVNAGTATVTVKGAGGYSGEKSATFEIAPASIEGAKVGLSDAEYVFDGAAKEPQVTVELGDKQLVAEDDYEVSYSENVNAGTATATVKGKGNYAESASAQFVIKPASIEGAEIAVPDQLYSGEALTPDVSASLGDVQLVQNVDFEVRYADNTEIGTAGVTVTGIGNYAGEVSGGFRICAGIIDEGAIEGVADAVYPGGPVRPEPTVTVGGKVLELWKDYEIMYANNRQAGSAAVTITGIGDYGGEATVGFEILKRKVTLTSPSARKLYDGKALTAPDVAVGGDGFAEGEVTDIKAVGSVVGTAEGGGSARNRIVYTEGAGFLAGNYDITLAEGTLTIEPLPKQSLTIKYVYADGKQAKAPYVKKYVEGASYNVAIPAIAGYQATVNGVKASSVKGTMGKKDVAVTVTYTAIVPSGKGVARPHRLWGQTALDTMSKIVDAGSFPKGGTVVLATSEGYWDALTAAGVAGLADAPVLMTDGGSLSAQTRAQIAKLKPRTIVICGGPIAVSRAVESQAKSAAGGATAIRCQGDTATGTACKIFENGSRFGTWSDAAFVCTNAGYWDALAAAPISYARHMPIFLTEGASDISDETVAAMRRGGVKKAYIVGGRYAITQAVLDKLARNNIEVVDRLWGDDAIATSERVARFGTGTMGMSADRMGVATNGGYWDALAGAALCGREGSVLVLVDGPSAGSIAGFMAGARDDISDFYIFGGTAAVSKATENAAVKAAK